MKNLTLHERFWSKTKSVESGCIEWTAAKDKDGYGLFKVKDRMLRAHRAIFVLFKNIELKPQDIILHACDNPPCVNPEHLTVGTHSENVRDSVSKGRQKEIRKTHCPNGHPYSDENLYIVPKTGKRQCKTCRKIANDKSIQKARSNS